MLSLFTRGWKTLLDSWRETRKEEEERWVEKSHFLISEAGEIARRPLLFNQNVSS